MCYTLREKKRKLIGESTIPNVSPKMETTRILKTQFQIMSREIHNLINLQQGTVKRGISCHQIQQRLGANAIENNEATWVFVRGY